MMGERERLIKLIEDGSCSYLSTEKCKNLMCECRTCCEQVLADYLLKNGVVEVVRCKDCKYFIDREGKCYGQDILAEEGYDCYKNENDFCSYGERRCNK